jgi:hypothetical protein
LPITIAQEIQWCLFDGGPLRAMQKQIGAMSSRIGLLLDTHGESQHSFRQFAAVPIGCAEHSVTHPWAGGSFGKISSDISPVTH